MTMHTFDVVSLVILTSLKKYTYFKYKKNVNKNLHFLLFKWNIGYPDDFNLIQSNNILSDYYYV